MSKKKILILSVAVLLIAGVSFFFKDIGNKEKQSGFAVTQLESTKKLHLRVLTGMIYRHLVGYKLVCKEEGIELKKYPDYFAKKYQLGISKVDAVWKKEGTTLNDVLIHFDPKLYDNISVDIKKELIDIERFAAKYVLAYQNNVSIEDFNWTEEFENKLNLKDACFLLDEEASFLLDNSAFDKDFKDRLKELK